jgi:hypothetical protein
MTTRQFRQLPIDEKTNYLWDYGVCFGQRLVNNRYVVSIFRLNHFYVEARYSRNNNAVEHIRVIAEIADWEAYVDRVLDQALRLN